MVAEIVPKNLSKAPPVPGLFKYFAKPMSVSTKTLYEMCGIRLRNKLEAEDEFSMTDIEDE